MRHGAAVLACLVVVGSLPLSVAGASVNASVSNVDVSPSSPAPGETVTFDTTVRNLQSSDAPLEINAIAIRKSGGRGVTEYERVSDLGSISPGSTLEVPLTASFDSSGSKDLRVIAYGRDRGTGENVELRYPVKLNIEERHPQVDITTNDSVAGVESAGEVTVANGLDSQITNVEVVVEGDGVEMTESRTVSSRVEQNGSMTAPFRFRPESAGEHELTATVSYTVDGDTTRTTTRTTVIDADPLRNSVELDTTAVGSGTDRALRVAVSNGANAPLSDVMVSATSENASFQRVLLENISASTTRQVRLNATMDEPQADVTVTANYDLGSETEQATTETTLRSVPGTIDITGLDVVRQGGRLQISGSASNVGSTDADSVLVSVVDTENVTPATPNRDYFVGTVPASDFVSFDVYARTEGNATSVPLEVTYLVDDTRKRQTFDVDIDRMGGSAQQPAGQDGNSEDEDQNSMLPVFIAGGLALLVVVGVLVRRYRSSDDDIEV
ncbi:hypothetical protein SAMN05443574_106197 [Haloarcula vallismortis]|uniref:CARDB domain-containing protein n=2 Tax=Haloarcula vallismortis TaxID=28442 RepID=M0JHZ0_HALVA|nr:hypothetical protein [Haloarcula vallismortis]EMA07609.1 hypothetical protein C437_09193 [Haloarcula vallismortis ATCC 29715]SDW76232.1 hypothetical protein SAMN05443574_106197 [Haloarcula vallismortis]